MQVHTRSEHNITAILQGFVTDSLTHLAHQVGVPGRSQTGSNRETGSKIATAVTFAMSINMNTGRTITLNGSRNAETRDGYSSTRSTRHEPLLMSEHSATARESIVTTAHQQLGFFFQGHRLDYFVDVVGIQFWCRLRHHCSCHCSCRNGKSQFLVVHHFVVYLVSYYYSISCFFRFMQSFRILHFFKNLLQI